MKRIIAVVLLLAVLFTTAACGTNTNTNPTDNSGPTQGNEDGKKLSVLYMSGIYADSARSMVDEFKAETGYDVEVNDVPFASFHEKAMLDLASQSGSYDVIAVNLSWLGEFSPYLEPLEPYIEKSNMDTSDFIPSILDACRWEDVLYGFPKAPTPNMMTYRTDLVEEPPKTYEEYIEIAKQYTDPSKGMYGISIPGKKEQYAVLYLVRSWAMGADVTDADWNVTVNGEIGRKAMTQLGEVAKYSDPAGLSWGLEESINAFLQGNAVFCESWPTLGVIQNADNPEKSKIVGKWALAPFPEEDTGMKQMSIWAVSVPKYSKNKDAAFKFVSSYSAPDKQRVFYEEYGVLPSLTSFWESDEIKNSSIAPIGEALKKSLPKWRIPVSAELDTIMATAVSSYMSKQMDLDKTMSFFEDQLKAALKNNPPPEGVQNSNALAIEAAKN